MAHTCPVCAYPTLREAPRSSSGGGSCEICPSCGFQFGVSDDDQGIAHAAWRKSWVTSGMKWNSKGIKPPKGWDPVAQLKKVALAAGKRKPKAK